MPMNPTALLISDIYGMHGGNTAYLSDWTIWLQQLGYCPDTVYLDTLCPDAYTSTPFDLNSTHQHLVEKGMQAASARLRMLLNERSPAVVMGFSLGGYLACIAGDVLPAHSRLIAISSTRLRYLEHLDCRAPCTVLFGELDPHRPQHRLSSAAGLNNILIPAAGHDVYRDAQVCQAFLIPAFNSHAGSSQT